MSQLDQKHIGERRSPIFTEKLSLLILAVAATGGFIVLLDPSVSGTVFGYEWKLGAGEFSEGLKGAVINTMMLGGWTALIAYWLRPQEDEEKTKALTRIAEQSAPVAAAAAAAATVGAIPTGSVVTPAPRNPETGVVPAAEAATTTDEVPKP